MRESQQEVEQLRAELANSAESNRFDPLESVLTPEMSSMVSLVAGP